MPYTAESYVKRAEECVRLANATADAMLSAALLRLRQDYLRIAYNLADNRGLPRSA